MGGGGSDPFFNDDAKLLIIVLRVGKDKKGWQQEIEMVLLINNGLNV